MAPAAVVADAVPAMVAADRAVAVGVVPEVAGMGTGLPAAETVDQRAVGAQFILHRIAAPECLPLYTTRNSQPRSNQIMTIRGEGSRVQFSKAQVAPMTARLMLISVQLTR